MTRPISLRQIEAFKAVIENGTINRAADIQGVSQPAMSKMIAGLEFDTGLRLFDRVKGRLAPTEHAMRLYDEVGRIFAGVRQIDNAVQAIRREEQGRLAIGVLPTLANSFIQRAVTTFLEERNTIYCSVESLGSPSIVDRLISRDLDAGVVGAGYENPYVSFEPLMEHALVCAMHPGHHLAAKKLIEAKDLDGEPFVALRSDTYVGHQVEATLAAHNVKPQIALVANAALMACEFVAAGRGVSLIHPLTAVGLESRLTLRRFEPEIMFNFQLCRSANSRNAHIVDAFAEVLRATASEISDSLLI